MAGDQTVWKGRSPNLFPYIARLTEGRYTYKGRSYNLPIHGFAPTSEFKMTYLDKAKMIFSLSSSSETLKIYPFEFLFEVIYEINENTLALTYAVKTDSGHNVFGVGAHPGFNIPLSPQSVLRIILILGALLNRAHWVL